MISNLVAVATDIKCSILFLVARQLRATLKLFRLFVILSRRLGKSLELFGNHLPLSLSRSGRRHRPIITKIMKLKCVIEPFSAQNRLLVKVTLTQQIHGAVAELARQRAKLVASLPIPITFSNDVSFDSLNHTQFSTGAHRVYNLKAHLIFVVAYRRKAISSRIERNFFGSLSTS